MSSSSHFTSGLSNWAGSDKPDRLDFVNDNQILDEDAMWKAAYDANGSVAAAGGIEAYTLYRNTYDSEGIVAAMGGIAPFVQQAAHGFIRNYKQATASINQSTATLEITSLEEHAEPFYDVQFIAPEEYDAGKPVTIDGELMDGIFTLEGKPLTDGAWAEGAPVCFTKKEKAVFFKLSGSAGARYDVVGSATQPEGKENRFWVDTDIAISHYGLFDTLPTEDSPCPWDEWSTGDVAIIAGDDRFSIVAYRGNGGGVFYPSKVYQWNGSAWKPQIAYIYHGGAWELLAYYIYGAGATADYTEWTSQQSFITWTPDYILMSGVGADTGNLAMETVQSGNTALITFTGLNLAGRNKLYVNVPYVSGIAYGDAAGQFYFLELLNSAGARTSTYWVWQPGRGAETWTSGLKELDINNAGDGATLRVKVKGYTEASGRNVTCHISEIYAK